MLIYATPGDLGTWSQDTPPNNAEALLRSASLLVTHALRYATYPVDEDGMPMGPTLDAVRDATCSQAATWAELGINPLAAGADAATKSGRVVTGKSIGPANLQFAGVEDAQTRRAHLATHLTAEATSILAAADLLTADIRVSG